LMGSILVENVVKVEYECSKIVDFLRALNFQIRQLDNAPRIVLQRPCFQRDDFMTPS
jgi:hypothetical protein